ncbi:chorismate pyruvate-lyase family protein [Methanohalobium sp.]|uniref:chorismate--pyruvate lyase family protein n=1 Tax=Methanohalobium sp. TaxID=2837493 RepID=UPI0025D1EDE9|nr:chorismate pyruvate-lyase family protein [Methanohalobium sp.]
MITGFLDKLKSLDIPTCLRVCAGTDGSITFLLEIMTKEDVSVMTKNQYLIPADKDTASLFNVDIGDDINYRTVALVVGNKSYVYARSLSPIKRMPPEVKQDMMRADIPIGKILRNHDIETRRDFENLEVEDNYEYFECNQVLSRSYKIIHHNHVLMWINELFPVDDRWYL